MAGFLDEVEENYDLIIINCAPTESVFTTAAYLSADSVLIPARLEFLSTIGLLQIDQPLSDFTRSSKKTTGVAGIVFSHSFNYVPEAYISKKEATGGVRRI